MPKSSSFTCPSAVTSTLDGFRSRCTTSCACACATARTTSTKSRSRAAVSSACCVAPGSDRLALDVLERQVRPARLGPAGIEQLRDVRVVERGQHRALAREALRQAAVDPLGVRQLQRHLRARRRRRRARPATRCPCRLRPSRAAAAGTGRCCWPGLLLATGPRPRRARQRHRKLRRSRCRSVRRQQLLQQRHADRHRCAGSVLNHAARASPSSPSAASSNRFNRCQSATLSSAIARMRGSRFDQDFLPHRTRWGPQSGHRLNAAATPTGASGRAPSPAAPCARSRRAPRRFPAP